ncbi:MAG: DUF2202 domain-containing protein [Bacteroidetes bacterium]|nr:DUF2202 domain-containing protein [Bacteroidota bacterium]
MKNIKMLFVIVLLTSFGISSCAENNSTEPIENQEIISDLTKDTIFNMPVEEISENESESMIFMREEEKLARDVYINLYERYGIKVFNNISKSEQTHMDAIKYLLEKYSIDDPVETDVKGVFKNQELQILYNQLIEQGNKSEIDALKSGALIEEVDIIDLINAIDEDVDNLDIELVYNNLLKGSENHLRAFVKNLSARGINYEPQLLDIDTFNSILNK